LLQAEEKIKAVTDMVTGVDCRDTWRFRGDSGTVVIRNEMHNTMLLSTSLFIADMRLLGLLR